MFLQISAMVSLGRPYHITYVSIDSHITFWAIMMGFYHLIFIGMPGTVNCLIGAYQK
jgi:hypothetical protein